MEQWFNEETLGAVQEYVLIYGWKILMALVIFIVGRMVARWMRNFTEKMLKKQAVDEAIQHFVSALVYYILFVFVVVAALGQLGIQTASFVAIIGAAGLAVGLALQGSLANFAAGVLILLFKPFKVGDFIEAAGTSGVVKKILIFTTELHTGDNKKVIIPNGAVSSGTITNYSANDTRRVDLVMGIGYDDDIDKAKRVLEEVVAADARVLKDPAPTIAVVELADSSVNFVVRPWVNSGDYWGVYFGLTEAVKKRFDQEGISIPYPQRDVHLHQAGSGN
ncbi:MAG: mechanosensitive ion channel [Porticoccaceae bacterium]|nr:mechanosensitive ion channel [Pseudomonadales bacterium]MCP5170648.1 mechanosensitive ion channel [Pseudomonadales bacterium]MCP5303565.1 mechanosensitive ion channel [Pseudomonadales bacterium]